MTVPSSASVAAAKQPAVIRYPGSKWSLAPIIVAEFGDHHHYVEPFFGSGGVYFTKEPSPHEVLNDANGAVVNFFRVLRDQTEDLLWALETTPWARDEYELSCEPSSDDFEDARRFIVRCWQAHASDFSKVTGWRNRGVRQRAGGMSHRWQKVPDQLRALAWRLADAEIENRGALEVIRRHSAPDCLIYADPPYLPETRTQKMYGNEMTEPDHVALLDVLIEHPGPVVVSGYASSMYDDKLVSWRRVAVKAPKAEKGADRTEILWVKPAA